MADDQLTADQIARDRFNSFLKSLPPEKRPVAEAAKSYDEFIDIIGDSYTDPLGLWRAHPDNQNISTPAPREVESQKNTETGGGDSGILSALGSIAAVGATAAGSSVVQDKYSLTRLENESRAYAEEMANEWNKSKDFMVARNFFDATNRFQQMYYDDFARRDPKQAKKIAKETGNQRLIKSIKKEALRRQAKSKNTPRDPKPDYDTSAETKLDLIERLAQRKAKDRASLPGAEPLEKILADEREKLMKKFIAEDPVAFKKKLIGDSHLSPDANVSFKNAAREVTDQNLRDERAIDKSIIKQQRKIDRRSGLEKKTQPVWVTNPLPRQEAPPTPERSSENNAPKEQKSLPTQQNDSRNLASPRPSRKIPRFPRGKRSAPSLTSDIKKKTEKRFVFWLIGLVGGLPFIIIVFVFFLIIATSLSAGGTLSSPPPVGNIPSPTPSPIPSVTPGPPPGNRPSIEEFLTLYNVKHCASVVGCIPAFSSEINFVYNKLSIPLASPKYKQLLTSKGKITIYLWPARASGCSITGGAEYGGSLIQYWGYLQSCIPSAIAQWSMIHETGHIIRLRNWSLNKTYPLNELARQDPQCYERGTDGYYLKTYAYRSPAIGGGSLSESLAESIGMNASCGPGSKCGKGVGASKTIFNYPSYCPNTYKWIKDNIYGGVDFFGL